jgi:hypothetical protein
MNDESWDVLNDDDIDDVQQNAVSRVLSCPIHDFLTGLFCHSIQRVSKT